MRKEAEAIEGNQKRKCKSFSAYSHYLRHHHSKEAWWVSCHLRSPNKYTWRASVAIEMATQSAILALPLDLQMMILDRLSWSDYVAFALAGYHDLQYRHADRFPQMTQQRLRMIRATPTFTTDPLMLLPNEMIEYIACYVDRRTLMSWVLAHYPTLSLRQLVPALTTENIGQLYLAWLRLTG